MSNRACAAALFVAALAVLSVRAGAEGSEATSWIGVQLGREMDSSQTGVPVLQIIADGPAHDAGLRARDRILSVDGATVSTNDQLVTRVQHYAPGSWIPLTVSRGGHEFDLRVRLGSRPTELSGLRPLRGWIGVEAIPLPPALREHFGAPPDAGVMISNVEAASPAEAAGVELGDVVFEIEGEPVGTPAQLQERIAGAGVGNAVELKAVREGLELVVAAIVEAVPTSSEAGR